MSAYVGGIQAQLKASDDYAHNAANLIAKAIEDLEMAASCVATATQGSRAGYGEMAVAAYTYAITSLKEAMQGYTGGQQAVLEAMRSL
jgi:hypothetical protein